MLVITRGYFIHIPRISQGSICGSICGPDFSPLQHLSIAFLRVQPLVVLANPMTSCFVFQGDSYGSLKAGWCIADAQEHLWLVVYQPLWKIWVRQWEGCHPFFMKWKIIHSCLKPPTSNIHPFNPFIMEYVRYFKIPMDFTSHLPIDAEALRCFTL